jgi:LacI family transcriptional regulator
MPGQGQAARGDTGPDTPRGRVTISEVARLARVSIGTVSNVLNNPTVVAPATRARVLEVINKTRFVRSTVAHQLRVGKSRTVGLVLLDIANPFFAEVTRGAERVLSESGYVLMVFSSDESVERERRCLHVLEEHRVEGLLITPADRDLDRVSAVAKRGISTVLLDRDRGNKDLCSVTVDDVRGGELAADHLFELGHRDITFVNGPTSIRQCADRRRGAQRALRRARARGAAHLAEVTVSALTVENGERAAATLLSSRPRPTAVMCANDILALGVLKGLSDASVTVPDEVAVVGYDDVSFASMLSPSLTSVRQPKYELGVAAAELLLEEVMGSDHQHRSVRFEPDLIIRASTKGAAHGTATGGAVVAGLAMGRS